MALHTLTQEQKQTLADALASTFKVTPADVRANYKSWFAFVLNEAKFTVKGKSFTLKSYLAEDDALHVTNLVLRRLQYVAPTQQGIASF